MQSSSLKNTHTMLECYFCRKYRERKKRENSQRRNLGIEVQNKTSKQNRHKTSERPGQPTWSILAHSRQQAMCPISPWTIVAVRGPGRPIRSDQSDSTTTNSRPADKAGEGKRQDEKNGGRSFSWVRNKTPALALHRSSEGATPIPALDQQPANCQVRGVGHGH